MYGGTLMPISLYISWVCLHFGDLVVNFFHQIAPSCLDLFSSHQTRAWKRKRHKAWMGLEALHSSSSSFSQAVAARSFSPLPNPFKCTHEEKLGRNPSMQRFANICYLLASVELGTQLISTPTGNGKNAVDCFHWWISFLEEEREVREMQGVKWRVTSFPPPPPRRISTQKSGERLFFPDRHAGNFPSTRYQKRSVWEYLFSRVFDQTAKAF